MQNNDKQTERTAKSYNRQAKKYEDKWKHYLAHTHGVMLSAFDPEEAHRILDVSAGTGLFMHQLLMMETAFSKLVLNDVSEEMLGMAKERLGDEEIVSFTEFPVEKLGFEDETFDAVISMNAFHNYTNQARALMEFHRVLKPGGRFYLLDWNKKGLFRWINFCIDLTAKEVIQTKSADEVRNALESVSFKVNVCEEWKYRFWNFFLIKAQK